MIHITSSQIIAQISRWIPNLGEIESNSAEVRLRAKPPGAGSWPADG